MALSLNGTHISGGTFNNVSGHMLQILHHAYSFPVAAPPSIESGQQFLPSSATGKSIGSIGPQRQLRRRRNSHPPYVIPDPGHWNPDQESDQSPVGRETAFGDISASAFQASIPDCYAPLEQLEWPEQDHFPPAPSDGSLPTTFNSVGGDMTQVSVTWYGESGMNILSRSVVKEALHDSGERFPDPACHPGTRTAILDELRAWSIETTPESAILWLHGSAGVGKSAVAQMFAGDCQKRCRLGASFFFRRGHPKRGTWNGLVPTIAYQLATSESGLLYLIQHAVEKDKLVDGRSIEVQFQKLLVEPFENAPTPQVPPILVLDGLDECEHPKVQEQILCLLFAAIRTSQFPIRMLVSSRPEPHLRRIFEAPENVGICRHFELSTDEEAYHDIRTYFLAEFSRIRLASGLDLGPVWPPTDALDHLVRKSSGVFIYAATVIRFVEEPYSHPTDQLESVLRLDPKSTAPLDDLYTQILSVALQDQQLLILHTIWRGGLPRGHPDHGPVMDPEEIDMFLSLRPGSCRLALRGLNSLLIVPPIHLRFSLKARVTILHASFPDYLSDARRSGPWCVSTPGLESKYLDRIVQLLSSPHQRTLLVPARYSSMSSMCSPACSSRHHLLKL
ncbi:hypothetical protein B0H13DRAFT_192383 [Mycena leptocephala]|nr:hypothetical protein B0H13DRAFT_192383 [Mycena leptocephala]